MAGPFRSWSVCVTPPGCHLHGRPRMRKTRVFGGGLPVCVGSRTRTTTGRLPRPATRQSFPDCSEDRDPPVVGVDPNLIPGLDPLGGVSGADDCREAVLA